MTDTPDTSPEAVDRFYPSEFGDGMIPAARGEWVRFDAYAALRAEVERLRGAAERVCWFDWCDNDDDAVDAISDLRAALTAPSRPD